MILCLKSMYMCQRKTTTEIQVHIVSYADTEIFYMKQNYFPRDADRCTSSIHVLKPRRDSTQQADDRAESTLKFKNKLLP